MTSRVFAVVGRTPWSAADAPVGLSQLVENDLLGKERVRGDPRGPGGPPHNLCRILSFEKTKWHWAVSPASPACGRFFHSVSDSARSPLADAWGFQHSLLPAFARRRDHALQSQVDAHIAVLFVIVDRVSDQRPEFRALAVASLNHLCSGRVGERSVGCVAFFE